VLSALGLAISDLRRDYVAPLRGRVDALEVTALAGAWDELTRRARDDFADEPRLQHRADVRYRGQSHELTVAGTDPAELAAAFHAAHERRYGYRDEAAVVEIVAVRLIATTPGDRPAIREGPPPRPADSAPERRPVLLDGGGCAAVVLDRAALGAGSRVRGPAVVEFAEATCLVRPGWHGVVDDAGTLVLHHESHHEEGTP
jgi:N-methylhydantoinase A